MNDNDDDNERTSQILVLIASLDHISELNTCDKTVSKSVILRFLFLKFNCSAPLSFD